jgi:hypothetical protein
MSMSVRCQSIRLAVALLLVALVAGCAGPAGSTGEASGVEAAGTPAGGADQEASGTPSEGADKKASGTPAGAPGAPGLPGPGNPGEGGRAPESPITIPPFQQIGGQPVDDVRQQIEVKIREECAPRHELCVTTVVVPRNGGDAHACFGGTKPSTYPGSAKLPRGAVLTIYSQPGSCGAPEPGGEPPPSSGTEPTEPSGEPPPSGDTEPTGDSQPPPSGDTESSEAGQPPTSS